MRQARVVLAVMVGALAGARAGRAQMTTPEEKAAPSATEVQVIALEQRGMEAFVKGQPGIFTEAVGGAAVMVAQGGAFTLTPERVASMMKGCTTASYTGTDFRATSSGPDVVILTYDARMEYTCGARHHAPTWHALSVWQRRNGRWYGIAHAQVPAVAPATAAAPQRPR